ncbi:hypothetical protein WA026_015800 [Henosepilachna vigintioctopunctata]|uniref:Uncharacterized protein n=1 Tax=Henosepilachna vigintioctopunctata TaxID=420089 RepID=A0AAW1V331_9CUCU
MFLDSDKSSNSEEFSWLCANFFHSVYEPARPVGVNCEGVGDIYHNNLLSIVTSQSEIETALDGTKRQGPDGISHTFVFSRRKSLLQMENEPTTKEMFKQLLEKIAGLEAAITFNEDVIEEIRTAFDSLKKDNRTLKKESDKLRVEVEKLNGVV